MLDSHAPPAPSVTAPPRCKHERGQLIPASRSAHTCATRIGGAPGSSGGPHGRSAFNCPIRRDSPPPAPRRRWEPALPGAVSRCSCRLRSKFFAPLRTERVHPGSLVEWRDWELGPAPSRRITPTAPCRSPVTSDNNQPPVETTPVGDRAAAGDPHEGAPPLSVIIVSYNTVAAAGPVCAERAGRFTPGTEVFVVDNASSDGSADMVRRAFPTVRLIANNDNRGFAAATNQALRQSRGRYVMLLIPTRSYARGRCRAWWTFSTRAPEVGVAGARLSYQDGQFQHSAFRFPSLPMAFLSSFRSTPPRQLPSERALSGRRLPSGVRHRPPFGSLYDVRRAALPEVGLLDESFFLYCEEVDWCWRFKQAGWHVVHCPEVLAIHHEGQSTRQRRGGDAGPALPQPYRLYAKHRPGWQQWAGAWAGAARSRQQGATLLLSTARAATSEQRSKLHEEAAAYPRGDPLVRYEGA